MSKRDFLYMKYFLIFFSSFALIQSNDVSYTEVDNAGQSSSWQSYVENYTRSFFINRLGWDPQITIYHDSKASHVINDGCTVYCHGWGEDQTFLRYRQSWGLLPGTVIGFNFYDAVKDENSLALHKSSFAQEYDCKALSAVLKLLDEANCPIIHLVGYSRGAATISNTIKRLKLYSQYKKFFQKLGISKHQAKAILDRIRKGTILLDCPLVDTRAIVKYRFPSGWAFVNYCLFPMLTLGKYAPWKDQAIDAAPFLRDFRLLLHMQHQDRIVTNLCDTDFYRALKSPTTHILFADDGGHFHRGQSLAPLLQAFRKLYNGPYYTDEELLAKGQHLLSCSQPEEDRLEEYFSQYQRNYV